MATPVRPRKEESLAGFTWKDPDPRLRDYVATVRTTLLDGREIAERVNGVTAAGAELAKSGLQLPGPCRLIEPDGYGRNLLYKDPDCGFVVIAMIWPHMVTSPVHDHGTWCSLAVLEGKVEVVCYERGSRDCTDLREICRSEAAVGEACAVLPPCGDIHQVWNPFGGTAVTLHTYGRDVVSCNVFDLETRQKSERLLDYVNLR